MIARKKIAFGNRITVTEKIRGIRQGGISPKRGTAGRMAFELEHNGRTYGWGSGGWFDTSQNMLAPAGVRGELNAAFIRLVEDPSFLSRCDEQTKHFLFELLKREMGVSFEKLCACGFFEEVLRERPVVAIGYAFSSQTAPLGRSMVNCKHLRDRFFKANRAKPFQLAVKLIGTSPFETGDLKRFLKSCGVAIVKRGEPVHAVVLGRTEWDRGEVDKIIDEAEDTVLQIYSQEMLVSILAGHPDPFQTLPLTERLWNLYAFRSGHPGLEYVANGWEGWVKGFGSSLPMSWGDGTGEFAQVDHSPLAVLGYRVGVNGLIEAARQEILRSAFQGPLPFVESSLYMEAWGNPNSAERLKRIAEHLELLTK